MTPAGPSIRENRIRVTDMRPNWSVLRWRSTRRLRHSLRTVLRIFGTLLCISSLLHDQSKLGMDLGLHVYCASPCGPGRGCIIPPNLIARLGGIFVVYEAELVFPCPPGPAELTLPLIEQMCEGKCWVRIAIYSTLWILKLLSARYSNVAVG